MALSLTPPTAPGALGWRDVIWGPLRGKGVLQAPALPVPSPVLIPTCPRPPNGTVKGWMANQERRTRGHTGGAAEPVASRLSFWGDRDGFGSPQGRGVRPGSVLSVQQRLLKVESSDTEPQPPGSPRPVSWEGGRGEESATRVICHDWLIVLGRRTRMGH